MTPLRKNIAAGNWKLNTTISEGKALYQALDKHSFSQDTLVITGIPATHLGAMMDIQTSKIRLAAQNCCGADSGAYTGEVSPMVLKDMGIDYVIIGHSERREIFSEGHKMIKDKIDRALVNGLKVIYCCGEPLQVRQNAKQEEFVESQLKCNLFHLSEKAMKNVIVAYEPIWAIGTGETASPSQAQEMHTFIRGKIASKYSNDLAQSTSILYGGSVKPANATELFGQPDVDGGLVGGASLSSDSFCKIIDSFEE